MGNREDGHTGSVVGVRRSGGPAIRAAPIGIAPALLLLARVACRRQDARPPPPLARLPPAASSPTIHGPHLPGRLPPWPPPPLARPATRLRRRPRHSPARPPPSLGYTPAAAFCQLGCPAAAVSHAERRGEESCGSRQKREGERMEKSVERSREKEE
ncbi:hypothetical protein [Oryza sativa Japonica Group]|uniref:Uncharacterized protein n=2 Tax=Oryza sativa subsp. japonica TaxID=39947 RepID=Q7F455_ORYSJ|nr:hypothetical protein [Oryza sativa Japonica Group]BAB93282.1 hypothetical protein [Oryza sativa Japonica Group]